MFHLRSPNPEIQMQIDAEYNRLQPYASELRRFITPISQDLDDETNVANEICDTLVEVSTPFRETWFSIRKLIMLAEKLYFQRPVFDMYVNSFGIISFKTCAGYYGENNEFISVLREFEQDNDLWDHCLDIKFIPIASNRKRGRMSWEI